MKKYVMVLTEREFHDMKTILTIAATNLPIDDKLNSEQKKLLSSIKNIAKQMAGKEHGE